MTPRRPRALVPSVSVRSQAEGTLHAVVSDVQLSFPRYRYPLLEPGVARDAFGRTLGSIPDLAAMKVAAAASRGSRKDFIDLYALGTTGLRWAR